MRKALGIIYAVAILVLPALPGVAGDETTPQILTNLVSSGPGYIHLWWQLPGNAAPAGNPSFIFNRSDVKVTLAQLSSGTLDYVDNYHIKPNTTYSYTVCYEALGEAPDCSESVAITSSAAAAQTGPLGGGTNNSDFPVPTISSIVPGQQPHTVVINWSSRATYDRYQVWWTMNGQAQPQVQIDSRGNNGWYPFTLTPTFHYTFQVEGCYVSGLFGNTTGCSNWTPFECVAYASTGVLQQAQVASVQACAQARGTNGGILTVTGGLAGGGAVNPFATPTPLPVVAPGSFSASSATATQISLSWTRPQNASALILSRSPDPETITLPVSATQYADAISNPYAEYYYTLCALPAQSGQTRQCVSTAGHAFVKPIIRPSGALIGSGGNGGGKTGGRVLPPASVRATWIGPQLVHVTWLPSKNSPASSLQVRYRYGTSALGAYAAIGPQLAADATQADVTIAPAPAGLSVYVSVCSLGGNDAMGCSIGIQVPTQPLSTHLSAPH